MTPAFTTDPSGRLSRHLLLLAAIVGCVGTQRPEAPVAACQTCPLTTDASAYLARPVAGQERSSRKRYHFQLISRFVNRSAKPIFLGRCYPNSGHPVFDIVDADSVGASDVERFPAYTMVWGCVGHERQFEVPPGGVRIDTLDIQGPNMFDGSTGRGYGRLEGRFRLIFEASHSPGDGAAAIPYSQRVSNPFTVQVAQ